MTPDLTTMLDATASKHLSISAIERHGLPFSQVVIFGAGIRGIGMKNFFEKHGATTLAFIDNSSLKQGGELEGLPVISLDQAKISHATTPIFIASHWHRAISKQFMKADRHDFYTTPLVSFYFRHDIMERYGDDIRTVYDSMADDESRQVYASIVKAYMTGDDGYLIMSGYDHYFNPNVRPQRGDIVIDGGAFNGISAQRFHELANPAKIISFEPTAKSYELLVANTEPFRKHSVCINKALWSDERTLKFTSSDGSSEGNSVSDHGTISIETTSIDATVTSLNLDRVDLIKLDVEGAELEALKGAKETINHFHPKLQVCLYHNLEDLWTLPLHILANFPGYKLRIGHHSLDPHETVLYACK